MSSKFLLKTQRTVGQMASNGQQFTDPASIYWPISSYGKQDSSFDTGQSPLEW